MRRGVAPCLAALVIVLAAAGALAVELRGQVTAVIGDDVRIGVEGGLLPRRGDPVTVSFDAGGVPVEVGEWRVERVEKDGSVRARKVEASGPAGVDMTAVIRSARPVARSGAKSPPSPAVKKRKPAQTARPARPGKPGHRPPSRPSGSRYRPDGKALSASAEDYYYGRKGKRKDHRKAFSYALRGAALGERDAMLRLGWLLAYGYGTRRDPAAAAVWYRRAAEKGSAAAANNLGRLYERGEGVAKDPAEARYWLKRSADNGSAFASYNLGRLAERGIGGPKDERAAFGHYRRAAERGHSTAMYTLGTYFATGRGTRKSWAEAVRWYRKAADKGEASGMYELGNAYRYGRSVRRNRSRAISWYRKAADKGHSAARRALETMGVGRPKRQQRRRQAAPLPDEDPEYAD